MRIAVVSTSSTATPPYGYGSSIMTYYLAKELSKHNDVSLFGVPNAKKYYANMDFYPIPSSYNMVSYDNESKVLEWYYNIIRKQDVVIDMSDTNITHEMLHWKYEYVPSMAFRNGIEFTHPRVGRENIVVLSKLAKECALNGISAWKGSRYEARYDYYPGKYKNAEVVNYGLPLSEYEPLYEKENYLLWFSRFHPAKGIFELLDIAKKMPSTRFIMAGSTEFPDHRYWFMQVKDEAKKLGNVRLVPDPDFVRKVELMRNAKALIYPLQYREAFGLVITEALAVGTPVLTYKKWVTPELHRGVMELNENNIEKVIHEDVKYENLRDFVKRRFTLKRMARKYVSLAKRLLDGQMW